MTFCVWSHQMSLILILLVTSISSWLIQPTSHSTHLHAGLSRSAVRSGLGASPFGTKTTLPSPSNETFCPGWAAHLETLRHKGLFTFTSPVTAKTIFLKIYLFERKRAQTKGKGEAGSCGESDAGLDPRTLGSQPEPKADAQPLSHPGIPRWISNGNAMGQPEVMAVASWWDLNAFPFHSTVGRGGWVDLSSWI